MTNAKQAPTNSKSGDRAALRRLARESRNALSQHQQQYAAQRLLLRVADHPLLTQGQRYAFYIPNDGEISPLLLMFRSLQRGKRCYLPRLVDGKRLAFHRFIPGDTLKPNRFGIPEPCAGSEAINAKELDVVFMPLVAFDSTGNRLGMGGGFYDRSFAFKYRPGPGPKLVGLAHHCQQSLQLPAQAWDVPMNFIITDQDLIKAK